MKLFTYILLFTIFVSCNSNKKVFIENGIDIFFEYGKVYYTCKKYESSSFEKRGFIIEFVPPEFEIVKTNYPNEYFDRYEKGVFRLPVSLEYGKFGYFGRVPIENFLSEKKSIKEAYCFAWIKEPAQYKTFSSKDLTKDGITILQKKVKREPYILKKYVNNKPRKLKDNQFYFKSGNWTLFKEYHSPSHSHRIIWGKIGNGRY